MEFIIGIILCIGIPAVIMFWFEEKKLEKERERKNRDKAYFLSDIKKVCERDDIDYQEPREEYLKREDRFRYCFRNEVMIDNTEIQIARALYWISKNHLCFVGRDKAFKLNLEQIEMYTLDGSVQYIPKVSNTGKDVSLSGAVVGGVVAGTSGMVIGATKDRNKISTEIVKKDGREVYIYYKDSDNKIKVLNIKKSYRNKAFYFDEFIKKELPTKSDTYLAVHQGKDNDSNNVENLEDNLLRLKKLFEDELIDKEDYELKKKELLKNLS